MRDAERPRIHTFVSTSDIHIVHQLQATREDVKGLARASVAQAKELLRRRRVLARWTPRAPTSSSPPRSSRSRIDEGATTINIPDTVGYAMPQEYADFLTRLYERVPELRDVVLSVHCHDDLGLAVANSFAGVLAGARQVECAINGIGERAGNASLEEIVMLLHTRRADVGLEHRRRTRARSRARAAWSAALTGYPVQPNKAIVGRNAFAHESGIHQDGILKERSTYEIMDATHGRAGRQPARAGQALRPPRAARRRSRSWATRSTARRCNTAFKRFKELADKKKQVTAMDLEALVTDELREERAAYTLEWFDVEASSRRPPHATVGVRTPDGDERRRARSPATARSTRSSAPSTPRPGSTRGCASSASTR